MGAGQAAGSSGGGARTGFNMGNPGAPGAPRNPAAGGYPSKQGVNPMSGMLGSAMQGGPGRPAGRPGMQGIAGAMSGAPQGMMNKMQGMQGMQGIAGAQQQGMQNMMQGMQGMQKGYQDQMLNQQAIDANGEDAVTAYYQKLMDSPGYQGGPPPPQNRGMGGLPGSAAAQQGGRASGKGNPR